MTFDDDLRQALQTGAQRYDPAGDGWDGIQRGVRRARDRRRRRIQGGVLGVLVLAVVATGIGLSLTGDDTDVEAGEPASRPTSPSTESAGGGTAGTQRSGTAEQPTTVPTTTAAPPTTAPSPGAALAASAGIWPFAGQEIVDGEDVDTRFQDPVTTADAFAREYLGMVDPVVGDAGPAYDDALTVTVRPRGEDGEPAPSGGPSTIVTLRPLEGLVDATLWTVVSAESPNIVVEPVGALLVASPMAVRGEATGYEGTVVAEVRQVGMGAGVPLGEAVGIAGASGAMAPFEVEVTYARPTERRGALVVTTDTGLDGVGVAEATVVGLTFADVADPPGQRGSGPCAPIGLAGEPAPDQMDVRIHLTCDATAVDDPGSDAAVVPAFRRVPRTAGVLRATLEQLVAGPNEAERAAGQSSSFSAETADILAGVTITDDGTAIVDLREPVDGASTSSGQLAFRGALNRTVLQFPTVERVEYRLDGSCDAFWSWQQVGGCQLVTRDDL